MGPVTSEGRLFCIFYALLGIPLCMIIIADVGKYMNAAATKIKEKYEARRRRQKEKHEGSTEEAEDEGTQVSGTLVLVSFAGYVLLGALLVLLLLNERMDFITAIYYNFISLTAIDFSNIVPVR